MSELVVDRLMKDLPEGTRPQLQALIAALTAGGNDSLDARLTALEAIVGPGLMIDATVTPTSVLADDAITLVSYTTGVVRGVFTAVEGAPAEPSEGAYQFQIGLTDAATAANLAAAVEEWKADNSISDDLFTVTYVAAAGYFTVHTSAFFYLMTATSETIAVAGDMSVFSEESISTETFVAWSILATQSGLHSASIAASDAALALYLDGLKDKYNITIDTNPTPDTNESITIWGTEYKFISTASSGTNIQVKSTAALTMAEFKSVFDARTANAALITAGLLTSEISSATLTLTTKYGLGVHATTNTTVTIASNNEDTSNIWPKLHGLRDDVGLSVDEASPTGSIYAMIADLQSRVGALE